MKSFIIYCIKNNEYEEAEIFISNDSLASDQPIEFQSEWLSQEENLQVPGDLMNYFNELQNLAKKEGKSFEFVCEEKRKEIEKKW